MDRQHDNSIVLLRLWGMGDTRGSIEGVRFSSYWWVAAFGPPTLQAVQLPAEGVQLDGHRLPSAVEWTTLPVFQDRDEATMSAWHLALLNGDIMTKG